MCHPRDKSSWNHSNRSQRGVCLLWNLPGSVFAIQLRSLSAGYFACSHLLEGRRLGWLVQLRWLVQYGRFPSAAFSASVWFLCHRGCKAKRRLLGPMRWLRCRFGKGSRTFRNPVAPWQPSFCAPTVFPPPMPFARQSAARAHARETLLHPGQVR